MNFLSRRTKRNTEISMLNLIDVIFMLLILFETGKRHKGNLFRRNGKGIFQDGQ